MVHEGIQAALTGAAFLSVLFSLVLNVSVFVFFIYNCVRTCARIALSRVGFLPAAAMVRDKKDSAIIGTLLVCVRLPELVLVGWGLSRETLI